jgi:butyryl-CoA dehydrogenase
MAYRTAGMIDAGLTQLGPDKANSPREIQRRIEEYAVECSILKVYGSEMLTLVADELIATMGGYGYVEEYPAERYYRDARINRIFEGTNEINLLIITGWLMKRALSGKLPLLAAIKKLMDEVMQPPSFDSGSDASELLAREAEALASAKKIALFAAGVASQRFMAGLQEQQEVMADLAAIIMQVYALESALLRARKLAEQGSGNRVQGSGSAAVQVAASMTGLLADETMALAEQSAKRVLAACGEGDLLRTQLAILRRLARFTPADVVGLSRAVARHCTQAERYPL